jgi:DNA invertase Pin-like site-specific DNA recombinase
MLELAALLQERGVSFKSLQDQIDTTTSIGKFFVHLMGAIAELERDIVREGTQAGLAAARAHGRPGGRRKALSPDRSRRAKSLYESGKHTVRENCKTLGCSPATFYRYIRVSRTDLGA